MNTSEAEPKEKVEIKLKVLVDGSRMDPKNPSRPWSGVGAYKFGEDREILYSVGPKKTKRIAELAKELKRQYELDDEKPATIDPYPGTVYEDVVEVLDAAILAGFQEITFVGDRSQTLKRN